MATAVKQNSKQNLVKRKTLVNTSTGDYTYSDDEPDVEKYPLKSYAGDTEEQVINKGISKIYEQNNFYTKNIYVLRQIKSMLIGDGQEESSDRECRKEYSGILDRLYDANNQYTELNMQAQDLINFIKEKLGQ